MNMRLARRILAMIMAASLLVVPLTAGATDTPSKGGESTNQEVTSKDILEIPSTMTVIDGPRIIKNELPGAFLIYNHDRAYVSVAFTETPSSLSTRLALGKNSRPFVQVYTITRAKSGAVYASFDAAATALGGQVIGGINIFLVLEDNEYKPLPGDQKTPVTIKIRNYEPGATYYIARVSANGVTEIIPITPDEFGVAIIEANGGLSAYGLIKK